MGSRTPQPGETVGDARQSNETHAHNKSVLREVQNEAQGIASPRQSKKEGNTQLAAQDSTELKDYVGAFHISEKESIPPGLTWS